MFKVGERTIGALLNPIRPLKTVTQSTNVGERGLRQGREPDSPAHNQQDGKVFNLPKQNERYVVNLVSLGIPYLS